MTRLELGSDAQSLVNAGRGALRPTSADRQRNLEALRHRIGDFSGVQHGSPAPAPAPAPTPAAPGLSAKALAWTAGALGVGGAVVALSLAPHGSGPAPAAPPPAITAAPVALATTAAAPEAAAPAVAPAVTTAEARSAAARRTSDSLAEEVSILSRAETELHSGRPGNALALLDEHQRKFPRGALAQERIAARIHALCALGRVSEAEAALSRLRRLSPGSLHEATAREACAPNTKR